LAGFQVTINGRFWVTAEVDGGSFVFWCGMDVTRGHFDIRVAGEFAKGCEIDSGHGHAGEGCMAEIVETERWVNCRLLERLDVGFAKPAYGSMWIVTRRKYPLGRGFGHPTRENREGAFGEWYRAPREWSLTPRDLQETDLEVDVFPSQVKTSPGRMPVSRMIVATSRNGCDAAAR
jgi:hypothetical protein